jgi:uncharacterized protein (DUF58 family)
VLTAADIARLDRLALGTTAAHATTAAAGLRHARARGYGLEVSDHRPYQPGDDPRQIDWNADARLRQLSVRVLQAEGTAHLHVALDSSLSMTPKWAWAARLAAALTYVAIVRRDIAGLSTFADRVQAHTPAARGRRQLHTLMQQLARTRPSGRSEFSGSLSEIGLRVRPPSFVVVISDFFASDYGVNGLDALAARGLNPALVQVLADEEVRPSVADGSRLTDLESSEQAIANLDRYRARFARMTDALPTHCRTAGVPFVQLPESVGFERALDQLVRAAILTGRR